MTEMRLTYHAKYERADRIAQILAILGVGEKLIDFPEDDKVYRLMNNGVLFVIIPLINQNKLPILTSILTMLAFFASIPVRRIKHSQK